MQKVIYLSFLFAILLSLTSRDDFIDFIDDIKPETFYYEFEEISQNAEKAEIIKFPHDGVHWLAIEDVEEAEIETIKALDYNKTLELLEDISTFSYTDGPFVYAGDTCFDERCVRIWYADGTFEIFSSRITSLECGRTSYHEFQEMLDKYLEG